MWVVLGIFSAFFLGIYDIFKKLSLKENAVLPVLFYATLAGSIVFGPLIVVSYLSPDFAASTAFYIPHVDVIAHLHFLLKAVIVATSWVLSYFAVKHLPITIVAPIRASGPVWTLLGAITIFGEVLSTYQWAGLSITLFFFYLFSLAGNKEGIVFLKNKWIFYIFSGTLVGTFSSLYDKYLMGIYDRLALQAWFSVYLVVVLFPVLLLWKRYSRKTGEKFYWTYTIPLIGLSLTVADFIYFYALSYQDSLISILSALRRSSVIVTFLIGALVFKEKNKRIKALILFGILAGIFLMVIGSR